MDRYLKRTSNSEENVEEPAQKKKREASIAWDHFNKTAEKTHGVCKYCGKAIRTLGNTTNLLNHLNHVHPDTVFYTNDSARKRKLDEMVLNMIAVDVQPFSCVEDEGFSALLKKMDPRYKLPSRTYLRDVCLPREYEKCKETLRGILNSVDHLALTTDLWTSRANEGYITITCHFISNNFKLESAILSTQHLLTPTNHTAANIAETIKSVLDDWAIAQKVVCLVSDNDASMKKACVSLKYKHLPCVAHTINLLVQDILKQPILEEILSKCKTVVSFFKRSSTAYAKFKAAQKTETPYGLVQEMPTRWNSVYEMIKRVILTNEYISVVLAVSHNAPSPLSAEEINVLKEISILLAPCADATLSVSTNTNVSISLIIPVICELFHKVNGFDFKTIEGIAAADYMKIRLRERLFAYETRTIPRIATILDPRFKKQGFLAQSNSEEAAKALQEELNSVMTTTPRPQPAPPTEEPTRFSFLKTKMETTVQSLRADSIILLRQHLEKGNQPEKCDPLAYWEMSTDEPFKKISKKFLCIPASSCESERLFSKAGQMISDRRTRLSPSVVDKLLFLNKNKNINKIKI
ncbi:E3 SUMO-protein ligase ZBED1-like [Drosophila rhopaloa]|uniref:BED-type domain-containing protein n=3 Tax=Drosophila rhopaloa TaxID=1041015 RepID=A0ABM5JEA3_DRORH|nr:E3 SUMO-protein ligase ZBED1-like [Drosophila rhopaloa]